MNKRYIEYKNSEKLDDLVTSSSALAGQVAKLQERKRILNILTREEKATNNSFITFDRIKALIRSERE